VADGLCQLARLTPAQTPEFPKAISHPQQSAGQAFELRGGSRIATGIHQVLPRMVTGGSAEIGDRVSFRIADVFLPEPSEVLASLTAEAETSGEVVEFSDSGNSPKAYAVVRITPQQAVLVPVGALRVVDCS